LRGRRKKKKYKKKRRQPSNFGTRSWEGKGLSKRNTINEGIRRINGKLVRRHGDKKEKEKGNLLAMKAIKWGKRNNYHDTATLPERGGGGEGNSQALFTEKKWETRSEGYSCTCLKNKGRERFRGQTLWGGGEGKILYRDAA